MDAEKKGSEIYVGGAFEALDSSISGWFWWSSRSMQAGLSRKVHHENQRKQLLRLEDWDFDFLVILTVWTEGPWIVWSTVKKEGRWWWEET